MSTLGLREGIFLVFTLHWNGKALIVSDTIENKFSPISISASSALGLAESIINCFEKDKEKEGKDYFYEMWKGCHMSKFLNLIDDEEAEIIAAQEEHKPALCISVPCSFTKKELYVVKGYFNDDAPDYMRWLIDQISKNDDHDSTIN